MGNLICKPYLKNKMSSVSDDFHCPMTHKCIPQNFVCDGDNDCGQNEDEKPGCSSMSDTCCTIPAMKMFSKFYNLDSFCHSYSFLPSKNVLIFI